MQEQDRILRGFPEVESVFGVIGHSDSATDNAPLDMYDTTIMLKPKDKWRVAMTHEKLIAEMDSRIVKKLIRASRKLMTGDDLEDLCFPLVHSVLPRSKAGRIRVP